MKVEVNKIYKFKETYYNGKQTLFYTYILKRKDNGYFKTINYAPYENTKIRITTESEKNFKKDVLVDESDPAYNICCRMVFGYLFTRTERFLKKFTI